MVDATTASLDTKLIVIERALRSILSAMPTEQRAKAKLEFERASNDSLGEGLRKVIPGIEEEARLLMKSLFP